MAYQKASPLTHKSPPTLITSHQSQVTMLSLLPPSLNALSHASPERRALPHKKFQGPRCCSDVPSPPQALNLDPTGERRRWLIGSLIAAVSGIFISDTAVAVSTSRRALRASKIPEEDYTTLPNGLKYYDLQVGSGAEAVKGSRVAVHYVAKWRGVTFMTSRQGIGVTGGTPYGFDVGQSERGTVLKGLDLGVMGMRVGGQRLLIVPPQLAYGSKGVQEIPPNATIELDVELLSIKQNVFGTGVKIVEG